MQNDIITLLALLTLVRVWTIKLPEIVGFEPAPFKPFNCTECMSFWIGAAASILTMNPIYFTLYLVNETYERNF